jgi:hypothetical protein
MEVIMFLKHRLGVILALTMLTLVSMASTDNSVAAQSTDATTQPFLGRWKDTICIPIGNNLYLKREFTLNTSNWNGAFAIYGETNCADAALQLTIKADGNLTIGNPYQAVPSAREAVFSFARRTITPASPGLVEALSKAGCGSGQWQIGQAQDVSDKGCAALGVESVSACSAEYDLLLLKDGQLYLGDRSKSLCNSPANRPTQAIGAGLGKVSQAPAGIPNTGVGGAGSQATSWLTLPGFVLGLGGIVAISLLIGVIVKRRRTGVSSGKNS